MPARVWLITAALACLFPLTAGSASAAEDEPTAVREIADSTLYFLSDAPGSGGVPTSEIDPLQEGHTTLWWSTSPLATAYRLTTSAGDTVYAGHLPQAFVSGLPDGEHRFEVVGIDSAGEVVATGAEPIIVQVRHWDSRLAWTLFALGAVVVIALLIVLLIGVRTTRGAAANESDANATVPLPRFMNNSGTGIATEAAER